MGEGLGRVLVADGDDHVRQQLSRALLDMQVPSDCVGSTVEALARLDATRYGVIVVDAELPPGDVDMFIRRVAEIPHAERPVVLALSSAPETATSLDVDIVQIVLRRPILLRQLVALVSSCLRSNGGEITTAGSDAGDQLTL